MSLARYIFMVILPIQTFHARAYKSFLSCVHFMAVCFGSRGVRSPVLIKYSSLDMRRRALRPPPSRFRKLYACTNSRYGGFLRISNNSKLRKILSRISKNVVFLTKRGGRHMTTYSYGLYFLTSFSFWEIKKFFFFFLFQFCLF